LKFVSVHNRRGDEPRNPPNTERQGCVAAQPELEWAAQHRRRRRISRKKSQKAQKKNRLCFSVPLAPFRGNEISKPKRGRLLPGFIIHHSSLTARRNTRSPAATVFSGRADPHDQAIGNVKSYAGGGNICGDAGQSCSGHGAGDCRRRDIDQARTVPGKVTVEEQGVVWSRHDGKVGAGQGWVWKPVTPQ
jgi:hypothetical protein